jgi:hypothetical protein
MKRALCSALLLAALPGCGLTLADQEAGLQNQCSDTSDCGPDARCKNARCIATQADLSGLVLQYDLPATAKFAPATAGAFDASTLDLPVEGALPNGYDLFRQLIIPTPVEATATLTVAPVPIDCAELTDPNGRFPASFEFYPRHDVTGLPLASYSLDTSTQSSVSLTPGRYDIYVVPLTALKDGGNCALPPALLKAQAIEGGQIDIDIALGMPQSLTGTTAGLALDGWTIDVIDNADGRVISTTQELTGSSSPFSILVYRDLIEADESDAVLRLSPPENASALGMPIVLWKLSTVDLDGDFANIVLDVSELAAAEPQVINAVVVEQASSSTIAGATVSIQSKALLGGTFGGNAAYKTSVTSDADGAFSVSLLPGNYEVTAIPNGSASQAIASSAWTIAADDLGGGRTIELGVKTMVTGRIVTPQGDAASGLLCRLKAVTPQGITYVEDVLVLRHSAPHTATTSSDASGGFAIEADPGEYDLSLRPDASSGFPWRLVPRLAVTMQRTDLGVQQLSAPVVIRGTVTTPAGDPIGGASVRAWLPTPAQAQNLKPSVILIGEHVADANGQFELLLPASLSE